MIVALLSLARIRGIIFDVDGLLLDSEKIFADCFKNVTGMELTTDIHVKAMGLTGIQLGKFLMEMYNITGDPAEFMRKIDICADYLYPFSEVLPGAREIVQKFAKHNIKMGVSTGGKRVHHEAKIANHQDIFSKIEATTFGSEITHGKPNPEIFVKTMEKLNITDPSEVLVFEDAPNGVKAAISGGMKCVIVPNHHTPYKEQLENLGVVPTMYLKSLLEFDYSAFLFIDRNGQEVTFDNLILESNDEINNKEL
ncbi:HAD-superfamily hydrolase, subfamily IA, variant 3 containing protein [Trichomonas vaginalis G3]|uniref:HAD-superfamily hydrolase, subfamily IA, variant 3 containing protein n=1 Tax=Trichomonas vaginalis (strain ATCC PRA-98 / G3) TaxID=412133 RepID=A2FHQ8_TRIV3|nr:pseudouridine 5'-phosphatase protein [Trichomonas vaginalis G3]EAX95558.1 HAD-superfamily hydrolase, subfamily IA, variant 3 containing protein [Trichomonas vaginalis G3]KAI5520758.1 pseudouridine 5'-phosphatase protein [Trichomonas vaginalis G3]|eukprot:XP_001308488.1 HAD-superfamily hydrolase, subfamily IA, variant 3 containing protein [Trichomonas vaginalis G3]